MEKSCKPGRVHFATLMFGAVGETNQTAKRSPGRSGRKYHKNTLGAKGIWKIEECHSASAATRASRFEFSLEDPVAFMSLLNLPVPLKTAYFSPIWQRETERERDSILCLKSLLALT